MSEAADPSGSGESSARPNGHRRWVRNCHWIVVLSFFTLGITGVVILMAHPRLYWGEVGNDLMPALLEFPISNNHRPGDYEQAVSFSNFDNAPISANRTYPIFNQNSWGRSLHFLAAWFLVIAGLVYALAGIVSGHFSRDLPIGHGAPLRARVETQLGYKSMKFLRRIVVTNEFDDHGDAGLLQSGWSWYAGI